MEFQNATLASISVNGCGSYGIGASAVDYSEDLYTYLRITDIKDDGTLNKNDLKSVNDDKASSYLLKPNDMVFARTGASTGRNYFYDGRDGEFVYAGFLVKFSIDPNKVNPKYVKYYCMSDAYRGWIHSFNTGSTRGNINAQTLGGMPIPLPPRSQQDGLVSILSALDDKIELNDRINENLEQQAKTLYNEYFIKHCQDYKIVSLADVCLKITDGSHYSPKEEADAPYLMFSVKDMEAYDFDRLGCKHISARDFQKMKDNDCVPKVNDILVAKDGSYLKEIFICNEELPEAILSSIAIFRPDPEIIIPEVLLFLLKQPSIQQSVKDNYVSGSALPRIVLKDFKKFQFMLPPMVKQQEIGSILAAYRWKIANSIREISYLKGTRDALLPRLLSGSLDVSEVEV